VWDARAQLQYPRDQDRVRLHIPPCAISMCMPGLHMLASVYIIFSKGRASHTEACVLGQAHVRLSAGLNVECTVGVLQLSQPFAAGARRPPPPAAAPPAPSAAAAGA